MVIYADTVDMQTKHKSFPKLCIINKVFGINISFFLSTCAEELLETPKIITFLPQLPSATKIENVHQIQYHNHYIRIYQEQLRRIY